MRHQPSGVQAEANERRSQAENRAVAIGRLRVNLALELRTSRGAEAVPSPLWRSRLGGGRLAVATAHADFPALLAEALDVLSANEAADPRPAGEALGCTPSQLVKLLKKEPRAIGLVNAERARRDCTRCNKQITQPPVAAQLFLTATGCVLDNPPRLTTMLRAGRSRANVRSPAFQAECGQKTA